MRATIPQALMLTWDSQVCQYPWKGEPGVSYFAGIEGDAVIHCLLYREDRGFVVGILNYYDQDFPPFETKGNVNLFIHRKYKRHGIGTALWNEAVRRWDVTLETQRFSPEGLAFAQALLAKSSH